MADYLVADKAGQAAPKFTRQDHDAMKAAINSKADRVNVIWYDCVGDEGNTLIFDGINLTLNLANVIVTEVNKDNVEMRPTNNFPTTSRQFNWNQAARTLTFKGEVQPGEEIKITYKQIPQ